MPVTNKEFIQGGLVFEVNNSHSTPVRVCVHALHFDIFEQDRFVGKSRGLRSPCLVAFGSINTIEADFFQSAGRFHDSNGIAVVNLDDFSREEETAKKSETRAAENEQPAF